MQAGINARAIDFAKFERLYLKNGSWNGSQVVPAEWVAESTQEDRFIDRAAYYPQIDFFHENKMAITCTSGGGCIGMMANTTFPLWANRTRSSTSPRRLI